MDIVQYTKKFHELELRHDFFNIKDVDGLLYWDIVRHDVFYAIYFELADIKVPAHRKKTTVLNLIDNVIKCSYHAFNLWVKINLKSYKYLCISCARYETADGKYIDYALNDIISSIDTDERLILETNQKYNNKLYYRSYFNATLTIARYINRVKSTVYRRSAKNYAVADVLKQEFGISVDLEKIIYDLINRFKFEYRYYLWLLKKIKPQKIFLVQNGIQKGFFKAAIALGIPVFEMQHGLVSFIHPAYDYPPEANVAHLNTFPYCFLSFSAFWTANINYPVKQIATIGNTFFAPKLSGDNRIYDITVISVDIYSVNLNELIIDLLKNGFTGKIAVKLHPNQFRDVEYIKQYFSAYNNVDVIYTEKTIKDLLLISKAVLAVQSTCVYEALDCQAKVLLYKIKDYRTHEDVFNNPNVYLVDNVNDIECCLDKGFVNTDMIYFNSFDKAGFQRILDAETNTCLF